MLRDDFLDILDKVAPDDLTKTVLSLRSGAAITVDALVRCDEEFVALRGREAGTNDDGRAFFVPYSEIVFLKLDRIMKIDELRGMFGNRVGTAAENVAITPSPIDTPAPVAANQSLDPAAIAKQNLLARIRAARSSAGAVVG